MEKKTTDAVVVTKGVTKEYSENGIPVLAVRGIDLEISKGEFTAIVGPSGSGKTTFLNLISGLDKATEGKIWLNDKLLSDMSGRELSDFRRDNIGFVFQAYNLIPVLTVTENIEYIMLLQGKPEAERREKVDKILAELGLDGLEKRFPHSFPGDSNSGWPSPVPSSRNRLWFSPMNRRPILIRRLRSN